MEESGQKHLHLHHPRYCRLASPGGPTKGARLQKAKANAQETKYKAGTLNELEVRALKETK